MRLLHLAFLFALGGLPPAFAQSAATPPAPDVADLPPWWSAACSPVPACGR